MKSINNDFSICSFFQLCHLLPSALCSQKASISMLFSLRKTSFHDHKKITYEIVFVYISVFTLLNTNINRWKICKQSSCTIKNYGRCHPALLNIITELFNNVSSPSWIIPPQFYNKDRVAKTGSICHNGMHSTMWTRTVEKH